MIVEAGPRGGGGVDELDNNESNRDFGKLEI